MVAEYFVRATKGGAPIAAVFSGIENERKLGELFQNPDGSFSLEVFGDAQNERKKYNFSRRVDGEIRPFSIVVTAIEQPSLTILKIHERLFSHRGKMYILSNISESKPLHHFHTGRKYISRLDNMGNIDPKDIEPEVKARSERRLRGTAVGEISGIGAAGKGHQVKLDSDELSEIGIQLAVASYLINSTILTKQTIS